ncbi:MAG: UDP-N-acetylmuramoyl-tripeptide--D-alanyl-D-alanine ligase, partial [Myxococcaceae bacterium]
MAVRFSDDQVVKATGARRVHGGARASYSAVCTDTRKLTHGCLFVALIGEKFDAHEFLQAAKNGGAAGAIVQKGRKIQTGALGEDFAIFEVENTLAALGGLARFHRARFTIPIGAVGGSNGKTTTKEMVASILSVRGPALRTEGNLNNEIGVPLTLFQLEPKHVSAVIEMGMNHKGEMTRLANIALPDAAVITVVQPEHLEGLGSLQGVAEAEGELFKALKSSATAVVNVDDPLIVEQARGLPKTLTFGRAETAAVRLAKVESRGRDGLTAHIAYSGRDYPVKLGFIGEHNAQNATAAFALCLALGYRPEECVQGLEAAKPYSRRLNV